MKTPDEIIPDDEIDRVHAYANFGSMTKRAVVNDGVIKYFIGYTGGSTQMAILSEHGLIRRHRNLHSMRATLTKKGLDYLRSILRQASFKELLALTESQENENPEAL